MVLQPGNQRFPFDTGFDAHAEPSTKTFRYFFMYLAAQLKHVDRRSAQYAEICDSNPLDFICMIRMLTTTLELWTDLSLSVYILRILALV